MAERGRRAGNEAASVRAEAMIDLDHCGLLSMLNEYKKREILWSPVHRGTNYSKSLKEGAWKEIAQVVAKDVEYLKSKIERLRGTYRREKNRIRNCFVSGKRRYDEGVSRWFAYELFKSMDSNPWNIPDEVDIKVEPEEESEETYSEETQIDPLLHHDVYDEPKPESTAGESAKRKKTSQEVEDESDHIGKLVAMQLRQLPLPVMLQANMEIQQLLMKYRLNLMTSEEVPSSSDVTPTLPSTSGIPSTSSTGK